MKKLSRGQLSLLAWITVLMVLTSSNSEADPTAEAGTFIKEGWQVRQGKWSFSPEGELRCEGQGYSSYITKRGFFAQDLELSVEVMFTGLESSAGLVFRAGGEGKFRDITFYQFEWYTQGRHHGKRLSLMHKNPRWKQIVTPIVRDAPLNQWITFKVKAQGELIECYIDEEKVFSRRDRAFLRKGAMGLQVFQPRPVRFRNIRLKPL